MNNDDIQNEIGMASRAIADLIDNHQDILEQDEDIKAKINLARYSLEFFLQLKEEKKALWEARQCQETIMKRLGLI